jgi:hypothetical protein
MSRVLEFSAHIVRPPMLAAILATLLHYLPRIPPNPDHGGK